MNQQRVGGPACEDAGRREYFRRLELVVQNTTNMVIVTNRAREIEWVNPAYTKVCGWTLDEVKGKNPRTFLHGPATSAPDAMRLGALLRKGQPVKDFELLNYTKDGKPYWVSLSIEPILDEQGEVSQYVAIQSDVTERKEAEQLAREKELLEQVSRTQVEMLGRVSHELRTPLHALLGFADMVERMEARHMSERSRGHLGHIRRSAGHLLLIVNDILDLTRLRDGRVPLMMRATTLRPVVDEVLSMLEPMTAARGITVRVDPRAGDDVAAMVDRQRLSQVLINLVGNAIKYNRPSGQIVVRLGSTRDGHVTIAVQDTGLGIGAQHLGRIFEPFYRIGDGRPELPGADSSGLGLAIAKSVAQAMQGDIQVHSEPGVGSTFTLMLQQAPPGADDGAQQAAKSPVQQQPGTEAGAPACVLYIDDNEVNRCLVEVYLQARPAIQLVTCATGTEGLELARRLRPTLMLVDVQLPDMSGHDVLRAVLDDPTLHRIPCVAFSADVREEAVEEAIRGGFREFLPKPIDMGEFLSAIDRLIDQASGPGRA